MPRPVLACGFRLDDGRLLPLELQRDGHALQGRLHAPDGDFEIRSLHALRGTPLASGTALGYALTRAGKTVLVRGKPFGAATVHHHAPIVMDISEIDSH